MPLWLLIALLIVESKENRHRQAWLIFVPVAVVVLLSRMSTRLLMVPDDAAEWFGIAVMSSGTAWAAVWLGGDRLARRHGIVRFIAALVLMLVVGGLSCVSHLGLDNTEDLLSISISYGVSSAILLLSMMLSGRSCRNGFRRGRFMGSLFARMALAAVVALSFVAMAIMAVELTMPRLSSGMLVAMLIQVAIRSLMLAGILYLFNLPFMLLAFNSPFYGARFRALFCPEKLATGQVADAGIPGSLDTAIRGPEIPNEPPDTSQP